MKTCSYIALALLVLGSGCSTAFRRTPASPHVPAVVHTPPSEKQLQHRISELKRAGHSTDAAERKARREFAKDAWSYDNSHAWANEKARAERSAAREKMEKELAKLP
ncbi:MAG TPA: hypothetical protein VEA63_07570 [Opitutus sp.]|nr:hypothetical protein [Opitutus sp.]